jgi:hypothetical protein
MRRGVVSASAAVVSASTAVVSASTAVVSASAAVVSGGRFLAHATAQAEGTAGVPLARKPASTWGEQKCVHFNQKRPNPNSSGRRKQGSAMAHRSAAVWNLPAAAPLDNLAGRGKANFGARGTKFRSAGTWSRFFWRCLVSGFMARAGQAPAHRLFVLLTLAA